MSEKRKGGYGCLKHPKNSGSLTRISEKFGENLFKSRKTDETSAIKLLHGELCPSRCWLNSRRHSKYRPAFPTFRLLFVDVFNLHYVQEKLFEIILVRLNAVIILMMYAGKLWNKKKKKEKM